MPLGLGPRLAGLAPVFFRGVVATILSEFNWTRGFRECAPRIRACARVRKIGALVRGHSVARNDVS